MAWLHRLLAACLALASPLDSSPPLPRQRGGGSPIFCLHALRILRGGGNHEREEFQKGSCKILARRSHIIKQAMQEVRGATTRDNKSQLRFRCTICWGANVTKGFASLDGVWKELYCSPCFAARSKEASSASAKNSTASTREPEASTREPEASAEGKGASEREETQLTIQAGGMVAINTIMRCRICTSIATFGPVGGLALHCSAHRRDLEKDVRHPKCAALEGCLRRATFGDGKLQTHCAMHRPASAVSTGRRTCNAPLCLRRALFGSQGGRPTSCRTHRWVASPTHLLSISPEANVSAAGL